MTLREWFDANGLGSISRLHGHTGIACSTLRRIAAGSSYPHRSTARSIAEATEHAVSVDAIYRVCKRRRRERERELRAAN
jgi:hypothetical protein